MEATPLCQEATFYNIPLPSLSLHLAVLIHPTLTDLSLLANGPHPTLPLEQAVALRFTDCPNSRLDIAWTHRPT